MGRRGNGEGSISRRKNGLYMARYTVQTATGPRLRQYTPRCGHRRSGDEAKQFAQRPSESFCRGDSERPGLDTACGSGNLLSVSMQQLLNSEREVITFAAEVGLPTSFPKGGQSRYHEGEGKRHHDYTHLQKRVPFS
jgi:hypothetical protein